MAKKEVAKIEEEKMDMVPFDAELPSYIEGEKSQGMESLGQGDFKLPRIKMIQPLTPEVKTFPGKAIPGEFWHTIANRSLGSEFNFVPCIVNKRVILWNPRETGGGMLAFSRDGSTWDMGGNKEFSVKIKNVKEPVVWKTGRDVASSGLLNWGTYNPDDETSPPAAQLTYEYLMYLPDYPELSPVVMGCYKTAIPNAKQFNSALLAIRKPIQCIKVRCFADAQHEDQNDWHIPSFEPKGWVLEDLFKVAKDIAEANKTYKVEYDQEEVEKTPESDTY